jgi:hypothetical protein
MPEHDADATEAHRSSVGKVQLVEQIQNKCTVEMLAASAPVVSAAPAEVEVQLAHSAPEREAEADWDFLSDASDQEDNTSQDDEGERLDTSMANLLTNGLSAVR